MRGSWPAETAPVNVPYVGCWKDAYLGLQGPQTVAAGSIGGSS